MPAHPTFYCRKAIYDHLGGYDDSFYIAGDFELMLRFLEKNNIRSKFIDQTLIKMSTGGLSNSGLASKIKIIKEEIRALNQNKINYSLPKYFFHKALKIKEFFWLTILAKNNSWKAFSWPVAPEPDCIP